MSHNGALYKSSYPIVTQYNLSWVTPSVFKSLPQKNRVAAGLYVSEFSTHLSLPICKQARRDCEGQWESGEGSSKSEEEGHEQQPQGLQGRPKPWQTSLEIDPLQPIIQWEFLLPPTMWWKNMIAMNCLASSPSWVSQASHKAKSQHGLFLLPSAMENIITLIHGPIISAFLQDHFCLPTRTWIKSFQSPSLATKGHINPSLLHGWYSMLLAWSELCPVRFFILQKQ